MRIQVLGTGCAKCKTLTANVQSAADQLGLDVQVEKVEDIASIMKFGVMSTPALAIDGKIVFSGKVASVEELQKTLQGGS